MILSAAALAIFMAMPQLAGATTVQNATTMIQEKIVTYQDVAPATLPEAITKSLVKDYEGYAIAKAFLGDDGTFKVAITNGPRRRSATSRSGSASTSARFPRSVRKSRTRSRNRSPIRPS
jgi:hypothetical protein